MKKNKFMFGSKICGKIGKKENKKEKWKKERGKRK